MILKENIRSNYYDNIIQIVKTGGLIIINNISIFDQSFLSQIIHIINDANNNKYMDRSFRLIFTLTEPFINDNINEILLKNCIYFNVDLNDDIYKSSFKSIILESIKNIDDTLILFFSNNIYKKKILINLIFLSSLLKYLSKNSFYFNIYEIGDILLFVKKCIESNESEYKKNNSNYVNNYYYLILFIIFS